MKVFIIALALLFVSASFAWSGHLHKRVDGVAVPLSVSEEDAVLAEWAANIAKQTQDKLDKAAEKSLKKTRDDSLRLKLKALGLTDGEIVLILGEIEITE